MKQISKKQLMSVSLRVTDVKNDSAKRKSTKLVANMIKSAYLFSKFTTFVLNFVCLAMKLLCLSYQKLFIGVVKTTNIIYK